MKHFTMSQYANKEDLYAAKAAYWEAVARRCIGRLQETEDLRESGFMHDDFYWVSCGEALDEGL